MFRTLIAVLLVIPAFAQEPPEPPAAPEASSRPAQGRPSTEDERRVVIEMSKVRLHPKEYAKWLRTQVKYFQGTLWRLPDHSPIRTTEGAPALVEAIEFLESLPTTPGPLRFSEELAHVAQELVREQGPTKQTGHKGPMGSTLQSRGLLHGTFKATFGEVINYGPEKPRWTVMQLIIDDGVPSRGHRKNIFNPDFQIAGTAIGPHEGYGEMTVVDMADAFLPGPPKESSDREVLTDKSVHTQ